MDLDVSVPSWARHVVSDLTDMHRAPRPVDATKVARFRLALPDDVYFEYGFMDEEGRLRADPDAEERADNPWYDEASCVRGPRYRPHPLASPDPEAARGRTRRLRFEDASGTPRRATVYEPAGLSGPAPLVLVHDGTAYQRIAALPAVLEAQVAAGRVRPARLAFVDPSRPERREDEYGFGADYQAFLRDVAVPRLRDEAQAEGGLLLMGASLGGLASTQLALHDPSAVAGLALQSPAFLGAPDERTFHGTERSWLLEALAADDRALPWRVYQEVGSMDWLHDVNAEAAERLAERVDAHRFEVRPAGHNWTFWRDGTAQALEHILPPVAPGGTMPA
ncbi:MAG: alpha/beta hydrolase-fold protein [Trueperaceae bacterium]|nr:alpha/beta hydrolase-fold protein [Trueperaceae bacterium]